MLRSNHEEHDPQMTQMDADTQKRAEQSYAVIGAAMAVHGELGHGFLKAAYQDAILLNFGAPGLEYIQQISVLLLICVNLRHLRIDDGA